MLQHRNPQIRRGNPKSLARRLHDRLIRRQIVTQHDGRAGHSFETNHADFDAMVRPCRPHDRHQARLHEVNHRNRGAWHFQDLSRFERHFSHADKRFAFGSGELRQEAIARGDGIQVELSLSGQRQAPCRRKCKGPLPSLQCCVPLRTQAAQNPGIPWDGRKPALKMNTRGQALPKRPVVQSRNGEGEKTEEGGLRADWNASRRQRFRPAGDLSQSVRRKAYGDVFRRSIMGIRRRNGVRQSAAEIEPA